MRKAFFTPLALLAASVYAAKTDLAGCTLTSVQLLTSIVTVTMPNGMVTSTGDYSATTFQWDGTEQCQLIDCGGGRAPPKHDVGCPGYTGTDTVPSLGFPTASLTLGVAAAAVTTAPATPASSSSIASATPLSSTTPTDVGGSTATDSASSVTVAPTAAATTASASQPSALNPTLKPNMAFRACASWYMSLPGLAAVAMAMVGTF